MMYTVKEIAKAKSPDQLLTQERVVRQLVCGGIGFLTDPELTVVIGQDGQSHAWRVGYLELHMPRPTGDLSSEAIASRIPPSILWRSEWQAVRGMLELTLVFGDRTPERVDRQASQEIFKLLDCLKDLGFRVSGGLGSVVASLERLPLSFQEARLASGYGVVRGCGIYAFQQGKELGGLSMHDLESFPLRFHSALISATPINPLIEEFFQVLGRTKASVRRLHQDIQKLFSSIADLLPATQLAEPYYHILDLVYEPRDLRVALQDLCASISQSIVERCSSLADRKVREFQDYVGEKFMDYNLNITDVGRALQISPSYLGKLLKSRLGVTFVEFVTEYRMTRARELLSASDLMTYQVADAVGYPYTHYFSATFKKCQGKTPSEYRALVRSRGGPQAVAGVI